MRRIELRTDLPAEADEAWRVFVDTESWPEWGRLVGAARGSLDPGSVWTIDLRAKDGRPASRMTPRLVSVTPPRRLAFETRIGAAWVVRLVHTFEIDPAGPGRSVLTQSFDIDGWLVSPLWGPVSRGARQFAELGDDLARRLAQ